MKKKIYISAINFTTGGPLSVMTDCLKALSSEYGTKLEIIALVNSKDLYNIPNIKYLEFPLSKKSWFFRLFYEYIYFYLFSLKEKPNYWLSLHDITPNVKCENRFVYCHNPTPFYSKKIKDLINNPKTYLFAKFYKYLYRINIKKNKYVIVQQEWIRAEFIKFWNLNNVLVAHPEVPELFLNNPEIKPENSKTLNKKVFFYPSLPRPFKNFEIICEAYLLLPDTYKKKCIINLTISEELNSYARNLVRKYHKEEGINFLGLISRKEVYKNYLNSDCLIFPSKLETWGLPITEYKSTKKPILLINKAYAKETLGDYNKVSFFDSDSSAQLSNLMIGIIDNTIIFDKNKVADVAQPHTKGWLNLLEKIFDNG